jgi:hypothetical protein
VGCRQWKQIALTSKAGQLDGCLHTKSLEAASESILHGVDLNVSVRTLYIFKHQDCKYECLSKIAIFLDIPNPAI